VELLKKNLQARITIAVGGVLIVLLALSLAIDDWVHLDETYAQLDNQVELLTNTIHNGLVKDMTEGRSAAVQQILEVVGREKGIRSVRIAGVDGKILRSSDPDEVGKTRPLTSFESGRQGTVTRTDGRPTLHFDHVIENEPQCFRCHGPEERINGVLSVDYDLGPVEASTRDHAVKMVLVFLVIVSLAGLAIRALLKRLVIAPVVELRSGMAQAATGRLDFEVPVTAQDEIGELQGGFNSMLARIKDLNQRALQQQRDLVRQEEELKVQRMLAEQAQELEAAHREVLQKNREHMQMLSFISHEMKNPVTVLKGYSTLLLAGQLGTLPEPQREAARAMQRNSELLESMIANYLSLARIEAGEMKPEKRRIDLVVDVLEPVVLELTEALRISAHTVALKIEQGDMAIVADPDMLKSVVANLLSNAGKYGRAGTTIEVEVKAAVESLTLSVRNEGDGIGEADRAKLFERFTRLDTAATRAKKGSGLGLWILREIVARHGGQVRVESQEGDGARFVVTLPRQETPPKS